LDFRKLVNSGRYADIKEWIDSGGSVNTHDDDKYTPLHAAAFVGDVPMIERLVSSGAVVEAEDTWGSTPLCEAARTGQTQAVKELLRAGASARHRTPHGASALYFATSYGWRSGSRPFLEGEAALAYVEIVEALLEAGADPNAAVDDETVLERATRRAPVRMVELLLAAGADRKTGTVMMDAVAAQFDRARKIELFMPGLSKANATNTLGALVGDSFREEDLSLVAELLERGASPNVRDAYGWTPLCHAAYGNHVSLVELLLRYGADTDKKIKHDPDELLRSGMNALAIAKSMENDEAVALLERARKESKPAATRRARKARFDLLDRAGIQQASSAMLIAGKHIKRITVGEAEALGEHLASVDAEVVAVPPGVFDPKKRRSSRLHDGLVIGFPVATAFSNDPLPSPVDPEALQACLSRAAALSDDLWTEMSAMTKAGTGFEDDARLHGVGCSGTASVVFGMLCEPNQEAPATLEKIVGSTETQEEQVAGAMGIVLLSYAVACDFEFGSSVMEQLVQQLPDGKSYLIASSIIE
jgi:uncharacterized protein